MYNIIETINSMAMMGCAREISFLISHLSSMLHYSLRNEKEQVFLREELEHLAHYLEIHRIRGIDFENDIDIGDEFMDMHVPRLILQPIAENCFMHAFKTHGHSYVLRLLAYKDENKLIITLQDNGVGISGTELETLNSELIIPPVNASGHLGLRNVHWRIRLMYGDEYGLRISSDPQTGTSVSIHLPVQ